MKKKKIFIICMPILILCITTIILCLIKVYLYKGKIPYGIYIMNENFSGVKIKEGYDKLKGTKEKNFEQYKVVIDIPEEGITVEKTYEELGIVTDIEGTLKTVISSNERKNIFKFYWDMIKKNKINVAMELKYNNAEVDNVLKALEDKINRKSKNAQITMTESGAFKIDTEVVGKFLDVNTLKQDIINSVNCNEHFRQYESSSKVLVYGFINYETPKIKMEDLKEIKQSIAEYSTDCSTSSSGRKTNIKLATNAINGTLIMPGETFSFNKIVGATTYSKGYQTSKGIMGDRYVDSVGGGVCQVSSTLYNAVIRSPLQVQERKNHSKIVKYVPMGQDAMISYGYSDLTFKNVTNYPVYIRGYVDSYGVTFKLYSSSENGKYYYKIESKIAKIISPNQTTIFDSSVPKGIKIVESPGRSGCIVEVYRYVYEKGGDYKNGKKELVNTSKYPGKDVLVRTGM